MSQKRETEWTIGKPEVIFSLPKEVNVKVVGQMPYVYPRVYTNFREDWWIQAAEVRPTALNKDHQVLVFVCKTEGGNADQGDPLAA